MDDTEDLRRERERSLSRRRFIATAAAGTIVAAIGGAVYELARDERTEHARGLQLPDGRPRLPPHQRLLTQLRDMGGVAGDPSVGRFQLRVHGEVDHPLELGYAALLRVGQVEQTCDVHCVTGWSVFDSRWTGVRVSDLADVARARDTARFVIFEAAGGFTTNVPLEEALLPTSMLAHHFEGDPLPEAHGAPVRALVPSLYFWKSAKWLTGLRFSAEDEPGYWERRGYNNHGDPWKEERYA